MPIGKVAVSYVPHGALVTLQQLNSHRTNVRVLNLLEIFFAFAMLKIMSFSHNLFECIS